jgi:hypothetical protein
LTHALRVCEGSEAFRSLYAAVVEAGERAGWLDLQPESAASGPAAPALDDGVWKAVTVEPGRTVAVKRRRGAPVLVDLLREHFRGCRVVLVRGDAPLPMLSPRGADWDVRGQDGEVRRLTTAELVRALRSPRLLVQ